MSIEMTPTDFEQAIKPLELLFKPLEYEQKDEYYQLFKYVEQVLFVRAVEIVKRIHTYARFPLPATIERAIRLARDERGAALAEESKTAGCRQCDGHGWTISITGGAVPCESCGLGKAISRGLTDLGRKKGKKSRRYTAQDIGIPED